MSIAEKLEAMLSGDSIKVGNDAIAAALKKHREAQSEAVANSVVQVLEQAENAVQSYVGEIRAIRKQEKSAKNNLVNLNRAIAYFKATGNPLPLYKAGVNVRHLVGLLGEILPCLEDPAYVIPNDWVEPQDAE